MRRRKKYHVRKFFASLSRGVGACFPGWNAPQSIAARLSYVRSVYGPYLLNTPGDRTFELCVEGYGPFVADAVRSQDRGFIFLDIGANLGLFSLLADANPHCERAIAFEPLPDIFRNLQANIGRNRADKIEAILGAVSTTTECRVYLAFNPRHSGMSKLVDKRRGSVSAPAISVAKLDGLFAEIPDRIVAKIDVEGAEIEVLSVLKASRIFDAIKEIIIEISEANLGIAKRAELLRILAQEGFEELSRRGSTGHFDAWYGKGGAPRAAAARPSLVPQERHGEGRPISSAGTRGRP